MKLGFYYHTPVQLNESNSLLIPSYLGVFLDSLASNVDHLYLFMHEEKASNKELNYILKQTNVTWVNLGSKKPAWHRALFSYKTLKILIKYPIDIDILLVRGPSPLAPYFVNAYRVERINYLIVGDYAEAVKQGTGRGIRNRIVDLFLIWNDRNLNRVLRNSKVIVNSTSLYNKYKGKCQKLYQIKTTTLSSKDIYFREDSFTKFNDTVNVLFTGRITWQKGLKELFISTSRLIKKGININLHIVGWEDNVGNSIEEELQVYASKNGFDSHVFFHGRKQVGEELNNFYRKAQIYVLPTYHEGFPRTIWEAMASGTPVITTPVGSIPYYLKAEENCLLVPSRNTEQLCMAIEKIIKNENLRKRIISNSYELVKDCTLEIQSARLVEILQE